MQTFPKFVGLVLLTASPIHVISPSYIYDINTLNFTSLSQIFITFRHRKVNWTFW